jgi:hypothetical protein
LIKKYGCRKTWWNLEKIWICLLIMSSLASILATPEPVSLSMSIQRRSHLPIGVAISSLDRVNDHNHPLKPFAIQSWPGTTAAIETTNKVPTRITYKAGDQRVHSWGYTCPAPAVAGPSMAVKRYFKFLLDPRQLNELNNGLPNHEKESAENVKMWFTDYLTKLHEHIVSHLEETQPLSLGVSRRRPVQWGSTKVDYIFSLPTSWGENADLIEEFRNVILRAGFGHREHTTVVMGLTEGVASAVYTAKTLGSDFQVSQTIYNATFAALIPCQNGNLIIVCDAGGATTVCVSTQNFSLHNLTVKGYLSFKSRQDRQRDRGNEVFGPAM